MITKISVCDKASFRPTEPEVLDGLRKINYIFGTNGTGKTTLSRTIASSDFSLSCVCSWKNGSPLETRVLNKDFVDKNFGQFQGVFTLGITDLKRDEEIKLAKEAIRAEDDNIEQLTGTLEGLDGTGGKRRDLKQLEDEYLVRFWKPVEKLKKEGHVKHALQGFLAEKKKFQERLLSEAKANVATPKELSDLERRAETLHGDTPTREALIPTLDTDAVLGHESNAILQTIVVGKDDIDIAAMMKKLKNVDWVRQGVPYFQQNDQTCPFCQRKTEDAFAVSLSKYFDETYEQDTATINTLVSDYEADASALLKTLDAIAAKPGKYLDVEAFESHKALLEQRIRTNQQQLAAKKREPSMRITLETLSTICDDLRIVIDNANVQITAHNKMIADLPAEKQALTSDVWRYLLDDLKTDLEEYKDKHERLTKAIHGLEQGIEAASRRRFDNVQEVRVLNQAMTSTQPTVDKINGYLTRFGFDGFRLQASPDGKHYQLVRRSGESATETLSEGEKTFVVFLYFYHLIQGSLDASAATPDLVVVFDDPVSSLDSDVLFIVSSLIRAMCESASKGDGPIKQVFIFTHNVYFHKEVTYRNRDRDRDIPRADEAFWMIRKHGEWSKLEPHSRNPVNTSYELLWMELADTGGQSPRIENTLRRILEYYFKILGGQGNDDICAKFDGKDQLICKSLFSAINAGSHGVFDDLHISQGESSRDQYLCVFKEIFYKMGHQAHYEMMTQRTGKEG